MKASRKILTPGMDAPSVPLTPFWTQPLDHTLPASPMDEYSIYKHCFLLGLARSGSAAWEVLTFDFAQPAPGTAALNLGARYDKLSVFPNFGVTGAEAGAAKTYYVDDITFVPAIPVEP